MKLPIFLSNFLYRIRQKRNLNYPNEKYILSEENKNKADLIRFNHVFELHKHLTGNMLDIGCNDGFFMRNYNWKFDNFLGLDLFDINKYTNNKYKNYIKEYTKEGKISYQTGLFEKVYGSLGRFNFVFAGEIIEHVRDDELFISSLHKVIRPNGAWCITTPNDIGGDLPEHARQYNKTSLMDLLSRYFKKIRIEEVPPVGDSWPFLIAYGISD